MTDVDFDHFCRLVHERSGLVLGPEKAYLVRGRLDSIARTEGLADVADLLALIRKHAPDRLIQRCVDALATHESSFFRDGAPFEALKTQVLPQLLAGRNPPQPLRIWCAACSSGQEPYSLAIALNELANPQVLRGIEIIATDFSEPILAKARDGVYSDFEVRRGLTPERLQRWFRNDGGAWKISDQIARMVTFRPHNLLKGTMGMGVFDIIFCRNVLIYFDQERKRRVLESLAAALANDGSLFLGSAETILGLTDALETGLGARGIYHKAPMISAQRAS